MIKEKINTKISKIQKNIPANVLMYDNYTPAVSQSLAKELDEAMLSFKNKKTYTSEEIFKSLGI